MLRNKKFEVKVVDDKPAKDVDVAEKTPFFTMEKIDMMKDVVKIGGAYILAALVINGVTQVAVANQENRQKED